MRQVLDLQARVCRDTYASVTEACRYRTMQLWGRPEHIKSRSGVRGVTKTLCKTEEEEGIQKIQLQFEGMCHCLVGEGNTWLQNALN